MEVDPVCGAQINAHHAAATVVYGGKTIYFCSEACRSQFEQNPEEFVRGKEAA